MSLEEGAENGGSRIARIRPLHVLIAGLGVGIVLGVIYLLGVSFGTKGGFLLLVFSAFGVGIAATASHEEDTHRPTWSELGIGLVVAGLLSFAVWMVGELRRPIEEREALQAMLGFEHDMPGVYLRDRDMEGFDLSGRNLEGADFSESQLDNATLLEANLSGADLSGADLSEANLEGADLSNADLSGADLSDVVANRADFHESRLFEADLSGAELSRANLRSACIAEGSLVEASLPSAHLERAALNGTDLEGAMFAPDLKPAVLTAIALKGAEHTKAAEWPRGFEKRAVAMTRPDRLPPPLLADAPAGGTGGGSVLDVPDGDTVLLGNLAGTRKMRPIGIDAPELGEAGGGAARIALSRLLPRDSWVRFTYDERRTDSSGRELVYLFGTDDKLVNQQMLRKGRAMASIDPPDRREGLRNIRYARQLAAAEAWARQESRGIWRSCPPP